jgi:hypothetical protein
VSSEWMFTIPCSFATACRFLFLFLFLFYGPGRWTEDVNNAYGFRVETGMFWVWVFCSCLGNGFLCHWKEFALADLFYKLKVGL